LLASAPAKSFQTIKVNYEGLGSNPLGLYLQKVVPWWSDQSSQVSIQYFVANHLLKNSEGRPINEVATELGFDCDEIEKVSCTYDGVYTYELGRSGFPNKRAAIHINISANFATQPWEIQASRKFLYGGIKNKSSPQ